MAVLRKNITIGDTIYERSQKMMLQRGFISFSEYLSALMREDYERQPTAVAQPPARSGSTPASARK